MTRTLVSGGAGFVGRFIVEALLKAGHHVTVMGRRPPQAGFFSGPVDFEEGVLDPDRDWRPAFTRVDNFVHGSFDHLPGRFRGGEGGDPEGFRRKNHQGSVALFEAARDAGVRRVLFLSSRAVYGTKPPGVVLTEETEPRPDELYGSVKLESERHLLAMATEGFVPAMLRPTGVYGPAGIGKQDKWAGLFRDYLAGRAIAPRAATEVHGADVAAAALMMLELPAAQVGSRAFNVSDLLVDLHDLLAIVQEVRGVPHPLPARDHHSGFNIMSTGRLEALGWRPGGRELLEKTVREMAAGL